MSKIFQYRTASSFFENARPSTIGLDVKKQLEREELENPRIYADTEAGREARVWSELSDQFVGAERKYN